MKMKKKILISICLVIVLSLMGTAVYLLEQYYKTDAGKTKIYQGELKDHLNLQGNKSIIKIVKSNFNGDDTEDYVVLMGEAKYDEKSEEDTTGLKKIAANLELYNNISIDYVDGKTMESIRYDTKKSYGKDVDLQVRQDDKYQYALIFDHTTGNVADLVLQEGAFVNLMEKSFSGEFCGYTINAAFNKEDGTKLDVSLDNFGRSYLPEKKDTITLDFKDTNVTAENYRVTYMANKFTDYQLEKKEESPTFELTCVQNILYANKGEVAQTAGKVIITLRLTDDLKYEVKDVVVEK